MPLGCRTSSSSIVGKFAGSVLMKQITDGFLAKLYQWITAHEVELVHFRKGERKDEIAQQHLARAQVAAGAGLVPEQVLLVGRAQEKTWVWRTQKRRNAVTGTSYAWLVKDSAMVNHFYV